ncbi:MAG: lactate utilization protein [Candidatus Omnitrophota bacterium]|nr:lactate utilization protein [Candidatus Omnitrophota bacterium]
MGDKISDLIKTWQKRNICGIYCADIKEASAMILEMVSVSGSVGISGSQTLEQLGIVRMLEERGTKVFNPYEPGITREESLALRRKGAVEADYYLASANGVSETGELVFFSAFGNRIAGISYAPKVIIVCGINKIVPTLDEAIKRGREYATPLNCKRLNWNTPCFKDGVCHKDICLFPEYKRMCCQVLAIEAEPAPDRLKVIVVGEKLGF